MNKKEFEDRTGFELSDGLYEAVERMYQNTGNMDKDEFCRQYKAATEAGCVGLAEALSRECDEYADEVERVDGDEKRRYDEAKGMEDRVFKFLVKLQGDARSAEIRTEVRTFVCGTWGAVKYLKEKYAQVGAAGMDQEDVRLAMEGLS